MSGDFWRRLRLPWRGEAEIASELDDELDFHFEMRTRELVDAGLDPCEARSRARRDFGDVDTTRRRYGAARRGRLRRDRLRMWGEDLLQDLRFGVRTLRHRPGFTAAAVAVLALGVGAPTTVLTLVDTMFLARPAHVAEPHRLIRVFRSWAPGEGGGSLGNPDYEYYRDNASTLAGLAAYGGAGAAAWQAGTGDPDQLTLLHVSDNYFGVLGTPMHAGRAFLPDENTTPGTHPVAVVSHAFWTRSLGGDPAAVGGPITLSGVPFTIVGVAPEGFAGISPVESTADAWVPIAMYGTLRRESDGAWWARSPDMRERWLDVVGRVADGVRVEAAEANLVALGEALTYPGKDLAEGVLVTSQFLYRPTQEATLASLSTVLVGVVFLVLIVAAANVAVLLMSRATTRDREIGVRSAMGASRARIVRQLVAESLLLGSIGGSLGVGLAFAFSDLAGSLLPLPFQVRFVPEGWVLAIAAALAVAVSLAAGLLPGLHAGVGAPRPVLTGGADGRHGRRVREILIVGQVALSLMLVAGSFLFARSFRAAQTYELGFEAEGALAARIDLRSLGYGTDERRAFVDRSIERLRAVPGVRRASVANRIPFTGDWTTEIDVPPGGIANASEDRVMVGLNAVAPGYFDVMGMEIVAGRPIDERDRMESEPVLVLNETLAGLLWPGQDPVGRSLDTGRGVYTIVGLVGDATYYELGEAPWTQAYLSIDQAPQSSVELLVRTEGEVAALADGVRRAVRSLDPQVTFARVTTLEAMVDEQTARYEVSAVLVSLFGLVALLLSATGLYGVIAFFVAQRTREIGVRIALGAPRAEVARRVVRWGLRLAGMGVALGLIGAIALRGYASTLLFAVEPTDPVPLVSACVTLILVALLATAVPAHQATRVDPVDAIRME